MSVERGNDFLTIRSKSIAKFAWSFVIITAGITILAYWINNSWLKLLSTVFIISIVFDWGEIYLVNIISFKPNVFTFDKAFDELVVSHQKFLFTRKKVYPLSDIRDVKMVTFNDNTGNSEYYTEIVIPYNHFQLPGKLYDRNSSLDQALTVASFLGLTVKEVTRYQKEEISV